MANLSYSQLLTLAQNAGFSGAGAATIAAIAMAESGGNPNAYNPNDPYGGSYGVLQINGSHFHSGGTNQACADNPACAFQYAYELSAQGTNFSPWSTFTSGAYKQYANGANVPSGGGGGRGNVLSNAQNAASSALSSVAGVFNAATWFLDPMRVLKMLLGLLMIGAAIVLVILPPVAKQVAPVLKKTMEDGGFAETAALA